jgi:UDP-N-acetylglucosamine 4-epimerase
LPVCRAACDRADYVLHQAALGSVGRSLAEPLLCNDINVGGHLNLLEAARLNGVRRVVYAASSASYGDHPALPKQEQHIGLALSPYALSKHVNELYAGVYALLRPGNHRPALFQCIRRARIRMAPMPP